MENAAIMDLERLKTCVDCREISGDTTGIGTSKRNEEQIEYNTKVLTKNFDSNERNVDRWSLSSQQRIFLATLLICTSLGHGHASISAPVSLNPLLNISRIMSSILITSSLLFSFLCAKKATELNRNEVLWGFKGLLGGPSSYEEILSARSF